LSFFARDIYLYGYSIRLYDARGDLFFKLLGLLTIIGGTIEEVVFRRWLMDLLMRIDVGITFQILISGFSFGLAHLVWGLFVKEIRFLIGSFIATSILGFSLAILYLISDRNIGPCIMVHSLINIIIETWLLLAAISKIREVI
jgi:uncharacterized protein